MRPILLSVNQFRCIEDVPNLPSHLMLQLAMKQGVQVKGLVFNPDGVAAEDIQQIAGITYFSLSGTGIFSPAAVDMALPDYCLQYLKVISPDVLIINALDKATSVWVMAAAEQGIPVVLDLSLEPNPAGQVRHSLQRSLVQFVSAVWVATAKHRQMLLAARVPSNRCQSISVNSGQTAYLPQSTERLWSLLRLRQGIVSDVSSLAGITSAKDLRIVSIMDEFTRGCFEPEANFLHLLPEQISSQLQQFKPHLFFIESAWKGLNDRWKQQVSTPSEALREAIAWCRMHQVPIVFWNKEDPVHFSTFLPVAAAADWVFTTDIDCIPRYKAALGHDQVALLPFAAQARQHNPIEIYPRKDAFNFAGSYYLRYPQRQQDFSTLIEAVSTLKAVEIYDRNANTPHPHYLFPERYKPLILGALPFSEIDKAYKGYRYGINMNTIKQSQTMFARRVFELMASNTVVVSNYSRGVRNLFGQLVICSDDANQLTNRLLPLSHDENYYLRFRLAGLRKVMSEHTYQHRLAYLAGLALAVPLKQFEPEVLVIAAVSNEQQQARLIECYQSQTYQKKRMLLLQQHKNLPRPTLKGITTVDTLEPFFQIADSTTVPYIAFFNVDDVYAENYLTDMLLARLYSEAKVFTKAAIFKVQDGDVSLADTDKSYQYVNGAKLRSSVVVRALLDRTLLSNWLANPEHSIQNTSALSLDPFNYCYNGQTLSDRLLLAPIHDIMLTDTGVSAKALYQLAEALPAKAASQQYDDEDEQLKTLTAQQLNSFISDQAIAGVIRQFAEGQLHLASALDAQSHRYVYLAKRFNRAELNLVLNSQFQLQVASCNGDVRTVFEFYSSNGKRLGHAINRDAGEKHSLAIPEECTQLRFGIRLQGQADVRINGLVLGALAEIADVVTAKSATLVLTKQYPAYDDLYKYGFLHSRVRAYREHGLAVDVFKIAGKKAQLYREFEDVDVIEGDYTLLDQTLASGQYQHVLVHFLDNRKWQVLQKHLDKIKVTVWVHGAEIQVWQRREYEFERMDAAEVLRQKKLSAARVKFWQSVLNPMHQNLKLVFVSEYFANESFADIGVNVSRENYSIIHNYVDTNLFKYIPKPAAQRLKLLSIRPYASRKYANDLTIKAIELLSQKPFFPELDICLAGDGELFDELTASVKRFSNVKLLKGFMQHADIARLHQDYGVFLTPTRMDSQGVSRDEAMSSGLVPITNKVAAIPEFVDENCGFTVPAEDAAAMAEAVEYMYYNPDVFCQLSAAAATRVRKQCGFEQTIKHETQLIGSMQ